MFEFGWYGDAEFSHLLLVYTDVDFSFIFEIKPLLSIVIYVVDFSFFHQFNYVLPFPSGLKSFY